MSFSIRLLLPEDDRGSFCSGNDELDRFFHLYAGQNQFRHHIGSTYVAIEDGTGRILGYATVAPAHLDELPEHLRGRLPKYPLPVLRLARLAVSRNARGQSIGSSLLRFVFQLAIVLATDYGCIGVVVDAKPDAVNFYKQFGFYKGELLQGRSGARPASTTMFLSLDTIRQAIKS